jgi:hypothetical protein
VELVANQTDLVERYLLEQFADVKQASAVPAVEEEADEVVAVAEADRLLNQESGEVDLPYDKNRASLSYPQVDKSGV